MASDKPMMVGYRCAKRAHAEARPTPRDEPRSTLTIHEGEWAYCHFDATAAGHEWIRNTRSLQDLRRGPAHGQRARRFA